VTAAKSNDARRNKKRWKQNPGVNPRAATGRTTGGYSPAAVLRRAAKRAAPRPL
jgi:hypothetical protein